jgi:hypothetical protein
MMGIINPAAAHPLTETRSFLTESSEIENRNRRLINKFLAPNSSKSYIEDGFVYTQWLPVLYTSTLAFHNLIIILLEVHNPAEAPHPSIDAYVVRIRLLSVSWVYRDVGLIPIERVLLASSASYAESA